MKRRILLLLRSYGDFIIAITTYSRSGRNHSDVVIYASSHFKELYKAILSHPVSSQMHLPDVQFVDFGIRQHILSVFTNKYLLGISSFQELRSIKQFLQNLDGQHTQVWLEQKKRKKLFELFTKTSAKFVHDGRANIYHAYADFWGKVPDQQLMPVPQSIEKELVLPGSRKRGKQLPVSLVEQIKGRAKDNLHQIIVAGLAHEIGHYGKPVTFVRSFSELITLIHENDLIHCADSVAAHLCELFAKPHRVYFTKAINLPWVTPGGQSIVI